MTNGQFEKQCRKLKTEDSFYSEAEIANRCNYLCKKYDTPIQITAWFEDQIELGKYLGIDYRDLYSKHINLEYLFIKAREQ